MNWWKQYKKLMIEGGLVFLLLCAAALLGQHKAPAVTVIAESESMLPESEESIVAEESGTAAETETESESEIPSVPQLSEKQQLLVEELLVHINAGELKEAARVLLEKESQFISLFYTTMEGKDYLYRDGGLYEEIDGEGLVFQRPGTVFFGSFQNGFPEGENLALQAVNLDAPRYDYSRGTWSNGYMNGAGTIGYQYYQGIEGEEPWEVKKEGTFVNDMMEGPLMYSSTDAKGQTLTWQMNVSQGVTVIDDRWQQEAVQSHYLLVSDTDNASAYTLDEAEKDSIRWMNLIPWAREE